MMESTTFDPFQSHLFQKDPLELIPDDDLIFITVPLVQEMPYDLFKVSTSKYGRPQYNPKMLLCLVQTAINEGVFSLRDMERSMCFDSRFQLITGYRIIDFTTLCKFINDHEEAIQQLFVNVQRRAMEQGMADTEQSATDGTKYKANASMRNSFTYEKLLKMLPEKEAELQETEKEYSRLALESSRMLANQSFTEEDDAKRRDLAEEVDQLKGKMNRLTNRIKAIRNAIEYAEEEAKNRVRDEFIKKQEKEKLEAEENRRRELAEKSRQLDDAALKLAIRRETYELDKWDMIPYDREITRKDLMQEEKSLSGKRRRLDDRMKAAESPADAELKPITEESLSRRLKADLARAMREAKPDPERKVNLTDPESAIMKRAIGGGYMQGYNLQAVYDMNGSLMFQAVRLTANANDSNELRENLLSIDPSLLETDESGDLKYPRVVGDLGYSTNHEMALTRRAGFDFVIATRKPGSKRKRNTPEVIIMERMLLNPEIRRLLKQRGYTIEPGFGNIKENLGYTKIHRRGKKKALNEIHLVVNAHNIRRLRLLEKNILAILGQKDLDEFFGK